MGERFGHDPTLTALLDRIVADRIGDAQSLLQIVRFGNAATVAGPDASEVISPAFEPHRLLVVIGLPP